MSTPCQPRWSSHARVEQRTADSYLALRKSLGRGGMWPRPRMAAIPLTVKNSNLPAWLPTPQDAVLMCEQNGHGPSALIIRSPDGSEAAFVKYGPSLAMGEARTQNYIAEDHVNSDKDIIVLVPRIYYAFRYERIGYIIMQYVDGNDCNQDDLDAIALAVNRLRSIPSPTASPGPVGGGPVTHRFFASHRSSVQYSSVQDLQEHINNILTLGKYSSRVNFYEEDGGNLRLCLDDIHPGNFRKDTSGRLFALDFAKTNFLPFAFQDLAFVEGDDLAEKVAKSLSCSKSKYRGALMLAAGKLQLFNKSSHGLPYSLRQSIGSRDLFE